ncbi:transposase [Neoroseomonas soli]|uniref:Transposase n=1 Tax=Neoroseomonas soli TaxID=1081025 RepID=A0A9X9WZI9_9PROT|nr:transposase [Neoroseomonas soli]MBR0672568.1 transposase [Neoroseomonas soli]
MRCTPLTPTQFHALLPYILPRSPAGRKIGDLRTRMNAIFHLASTTLPWRCLPPEHGKPDTVSRYFRRLTHAGLWEKLLEAIKDAGPNHPLREIAPRIFRACRRAIRLRGLKFIALIRRLGFLQALNGPPSKVPDPDLSENLRRNLRLPPPPRATAAHGPYTALLRTLRHLHRRAGGIKHIPRALRLGWS